MRTQIHASVDQDTIDQINDLMDNDQTFSEAVDDFLAIAVSIQTNPLGKIFLMFGDKLLATKNPDCFTEKMTPEEAGIFKVMLKNVKTVDAQNWREKVKVPEVLKKLI